MPGPVTVTHLDRSIEQHGLRKQGMLGRGTGMGNALYAIDYDRLPPEARSTIDLIIAGGPFPYPGKDGSLFGNHFGDLPSGRYREYTVPTPNAKKKGRGARRIVARCTTGQLFFTACHYDRVQSHGGTRAEQNQARVEATQSIDAEWRNGFYIITGMSADLRDFITRAIKNAGVT